MTNHGDGSAGFIYAANKLLGGLNHAKSIRVQRAPGKQHCVEIVRVGFIQNTIDVDFARLLIVLHGLNFSRVRREKRSFGAGIVQRLARLDKFRLFHTIGCQNGHSHSFQAF